MRTAAGVAVAVGVGVDVGVVVDAALDGLGLPLQALAMMPMSATAMTVRLTGVTGRRSADASASR
jgi:hypothetical protein